MANRLEHVPRPTERSSKGEQKKQMHAPDPSYGVDSTEVEHMTDNNTDPDSQADESRDESSNVRQMRSRMEAQTTELEMLRGVARQAAFKEAGIDPTTGLGKAIYRTYDGEIDPVKVVEFATSEYDWQPKEAPSVSDASRRIETVGNQGQSEVVGSRMEQADEAASKGDWLTAQAFKDQELFALAQQVNPFSG
jgi:hypothetical protein